MRTHGEQYASGQRHSGKAAFLLWAVIAIFVVAGCSASRYRRAADKEVYTIVQQVERKILGYTNEFSIDTQYSSRKPEEIFPPELIEDRLQTNRRLLTIDEALRLAVTGNRDHQAAKETLYKTALTLTGERYKFRPHLVDPRIGGRLERNDQGDLVSSIGLEEPGLRITRLFQSGAEFTATLASDLVRAYTGDPTRSLISVLSVRLTQPLLRGFGRNNAAVEDLTQATRNVVYAVREYSFYQGEFAVGVVNDYFTLLAQKDTVRNRYTNYLSRVQSTQRLEARAQDRERIADVDQARQAELTAKNSYVNEVARYRNLLDEFKITLGIPIGEGVNLDDTALVELKETGLVPAPLNPDEAYRLAVQRQLRILNVIDVFEDSKRTVRIAADRLRPELNLVADASLVSRDEVQYETNFDPDKIRAGVGLSVGLPLDRLRERNDYRATLIAFEENLRALTLRLDQLKESIDGRLRDLEQRRQNYQIQTNALGLANRRVESSVLLLQAGRAEVRDLVEAQDAQINAQNGVTAALIGYQQARLQLMLDIGALDSGLDKFWLKDHLDHFLPERSRVVTAPKPSDEAVPTPDEALNN